MMPEAALNRARRVCVEWSHSQGSTSDLITAIARALLEASGDNFLQPPKPSGPIAVREVENLASCVEYEL